MAHRLRVTRGLWLTLLATSACTADLDASEEAAARVRDQDLGSLPYHPLVFHLDLSILSYQLYSQSLVWPFDPYYEELAGPLEQRDAFMRIVRDWVSERGPRQVAEDMGLEALRGPGVLAGFPDNPAHDPILYQYSRLHPWSHSLTNDVGKWIEYRVPRQVLDPIGTVRVCTRAIGQPEGTVRVDALQPAQDDALPGARDVLMVFEGGTGDKGEPGQPASQSLMGLALLRHGDAAVPDLHIAFRGSRSGSATRAALDAIPTDAPSGNPDWITDFGVRGITEPLVSPVGLVGRGMSRSMLSALPQLMGCLDAVSTELDVPAPAHIYLTGHSLGGGLAQHAASALLMGEGYGPGGDLLPSSVADWPWDALKLITYAGPRVGDETWARTFTEDFLGAPFFTGTYSYDVDAIGVTDPDILPRLTDTDRTAGYRVLIPTDPITSSIVVSGHHVGQSVYTNQPMETFPPGASDHEPQAIRQWMVDTLRDPGRIPPVAWRYVELDTWSPDRDAEARGTRAEYAKLIEAYRAYYDDRAQWLDRQAFDRSVTDFFDLLGAL